MMAENPVAALELPLKVISWKDEDEKVWIAYNDAVYIKNRFSLSDKVSAPLNLDPVVAKTLGLAM